MKKVLSFTLVMISLLIFSSAAMSAETLHIYCGAGMAQPFGEISEAFTRQSGVKTEVTYGHAGQIQSQINTSQEGDMFIAGAKEELKPVEKYVTSSKDLVKHIPVLAVQKGNPRKITGLADFTRPEVRVVLGDAKATPIGKISNKVLTELGILEKVNEVSRSVTAPSVANALLVGECDAIIVWKENLAQGMEIVDDPLLAQNTKVIPAATLAVGKNPAAQKSFLEFLDTAQAREIWNKYGYELVN